MKLPNGYGSVVKLSGKRRKPWMVRKTTGYRIDPVKEKKVNEYIIIGYAATKTEGLQMLADYNRKDWLSTFITYFSKVRMTFFDQFLLDFIFDSCWYITNGFDSLDDKTCINLHHNNHFLSIPSFTFFNGKVQILLFNILSNYQQFFHPSTQILTKQE